MSDHKPQCCADENVPGLTCACNECEQKEKEEK